MMSDCAQEQPLSPERFRRAWSFVSISSMFGMFYFSVEYYGAARIRFFTELKATPFDIGLIATIFALAFGFQLLAAVMINRLARRKPLFLITAGLHRILFLAVPLAPYILHDERARIMLILGVMIVHDALYEFAVPLYLSWMADLVPTDALNRHWGSRQRYITFSTLISNLALAFGFYYYERTGQVIPGFLVFTVAAIIGGMTDLIIFARVPEPPNSQRASGVPLATTLVQPLRDPAFRRFLVFMTYWFFITWMAQPFFYYYMIKNLGMSVLTVQLIMTTEAIGGVLASRFSGLICDVYGQENGIQLSLLFKIAIPLTLILVPAAPAIAIPILVLAFFLDGTMNAMFQIAWQGATLKSTPRLNRGMYIASTYFLCQGLAAGLAPLICGALIEPLNRAAHFSTGYIHWNGYLIIFAASLVLRVAAWPLAWRMQDSAPVPFRTMWAHLCHSNPLTVTRALYQLHGAPDPGKRIRAAARLARLRSPMAIGGLVDALRDPVHEVRESAAEALEKFGHLAQAGAGHKAFVAVADADESRC